MFLISPTWFQPFHPTLEDIYDANVATDRGTVDALRFFDTEGIEPKISESLSEKIPKHLFAVADGVVIVYSIDDEASFQIAEALKKEAEKHKEKKEVGLFASSRLANCMTIHRCVFFVLRCHGFRQIEIKLVIPNSEIFQASIA